MRHTYNQKQQIRLTDLHHSHIPLGARFVYHDQVDDEDEYILCQPMPNMICLIDINDGCRWENPVHDVQFSTTGKVAIGVVLQCAERSYSDMYFTLRIPDDLTLDQYLA